MSLAVDTPGGDSRQTSLEQDFAIVLFRLIQTVKMYQDDRQIVDECIGQFVGASKKLTSGGKLTCLVKDGRLYIQGEALRYRKELVGLIHSLLDSFAQRGLNGIVFHGDLDRVPHMDILRFVHLLLRSAEQHEPCAWLAAQIEQETPGWVEILRSEDIESAPAGDDLRERTRSSYWQAISYTKEIAAKLASQGRAGIRKARRMVQNMVDLILEDESVVLGASTIREHDDYTFTHSVNVAILSLCLGRRIGLSQNPLSYLGICGLFHDLGKVEVPHEILKKPSALSTAEWDQIRRHPLASVRQVLKLNASHALKSRIILAPFEHHLHYDLSGYPRTESIKSLSLFGRILQITDVYDAVTSPRVYRPVPFSPHHALKLLLDGIGKDFDVILTKVFVSMLGIYPVGTLVQLASGEIGLVKNAAKEPGRALPHVLLLEEDGHGAFRAGEVVDLGGDAERSSRSRKILKCLHPNTRGIQAADFIL